MALFYRGAWVGTYWNFNDARLVGFYPENTGLLHSADKVIQHVRHGITDSPYVSLTVSYGVALHYARETGTSHPTPANPGFVYEVEITDKDRVELIDPVKEIVGGAPNPLDSLPYQHNGEPIILLGIASSWMAAFLRRPIPTPPGAVSTVPLTLNVSPHLAGMVAALRDAEILVHGSIPASFVIRRHSVF